MNTRTTHKINAYVSFSTHLYVIARSDSVEPVMERRGNPLPAERLLPRHSGAGAMTPTLETIRHRV